MNVNLIIAFVFGLFLGSNLEFILLGIITSGKENQDIDDK